MFSCSRLAARRAAFLASVATGLLAGCGGGGGNNDPAPNVSPVIGALADLVVEGNGSASVVVVVTDDRTASAALDVTASADVDRLLPEAAIAVTNAGAEKRITLTPVEDELGMTTVTLTATDPAGLSSSASFQVTVVARDTPIAEFTRVLFEADTEEPALVNALNLINDAEEDGFDDLLVP